MGVLPFKSCAENPPKGGTGLQVSRADPRSRFPKNPRTPKPINEVGPLKNPRLLPSSPTNSLEVPGTRAVSVAEGEPTAPPPAAGGSQRASPGHPEDSNFGCQFILLLRVREGASKGSYFLALPLSQLPSGGSGFSVVCAAILRAQLQDNDPKEHLAKIPRPEPCCVIQPTQFFHSFTGEIHKEKNMFFLSEHVAWRRLSVLTAESVHDTEAVKVAAGGTAIWAIF